ncbi:MAG: hypothetical protein V1816_16685 [Pseudomonadota bacterium]
MPPLEVYLTCPNCGTKVFYLEKDNGALVFFKLPLGGRAVPTGDSSLDDQEVSRNVIFCTGCGWRGSIQELKPGRPSEL